jgi:hypothetical protein
MNPNPPTTGERQTLVASPDWSLLRLPVRTALLSSVEGGEMGHGGSLLRSSERQALIDRAAP